jgi:hypothetical protein
MEKQGYRELIVKYLSALESDQIITTEQVAQHVAEQLSLEITVAKKTVNVNMARLEKEGQLVRLTKGMYCKKVKTAFGEFSPSKEMIFCKQLLWEEDVAIGYETGPSALNRLGLISQMPTKLYIATNLYSRRIPGGMQIELRKPPIKVNTDNYRYLQILDVIRELDDAPVDTPRPERIIRNTARELSLDTDRLILIARKHYTKKTLIQTIDIMLDGRTTGRSEQEVSDYGNSN